MDETEDDGDDAARLLGCPGDDKAALILKTPRDCLKDHKMELPKGKVTTGQAAKTT